MFRCHHYKINSAPEKVQFFYQIVPKGFEDKLRKLKQDFGTPPVYIMENGIPDNGTLVDDQRIEYLYLYMKAMLTAITKDRCNVKSYTIWSFLDSFEWSQ